MTQQETIALWLEANGHQLIRKTRKRWSFTKLGGYYYVGPNGSWREGSTVAASVPVSDTLKRKVLGIATTNVMDGI